MKKYSCLGLPRDPDVLSVAGSVGSRTSQSSQGVLTGSQVQESWFQCPPSLTRRPRMGTPMSGMHHLPARAHTRVHAHTHAHTHLHAHMHTCTRARTHTHAHIRTCTHVCMHTHMRTRTHSMCRSRSPRALAPVGRGQDADLTLLGFAVPRAGWGQLQKQLFSVQGFNCGERVWLSRREKCFRWGGCDVCENPGVKG